MAILSSCDSWRSAVALAQWVCSPGLANDHASSCSRDIACMPKCVYIYIYVPQKERIIRLPGIAHIIARISTAVTAPVSGVKCGEQQHTTLVAITAGRRDCTDTHIYASPNGFRQPWNAFSRAKCDRRQRVDVLRRVYIFANVVKIAITI